MYKIIYCRLRKHGPLRKPREYHKRSYRSCNKHKIYDLSYYGRYFFTHCFINTITLHIHRFECDKVDEVEKLFKESGGKKHNFLFEKR